MAIHPILQAFITIAPIFNELFAEDTSMSVQDREKVLKYVPGRTIDLKINDGDLLKPGSVSYQVVQTGKKVTRTVGREVFGIPYIAVGFPVFDNGTCIGGITTITSIDKREKMMEMAEHLATSMQEFSASIESVAATSEHLHDLNETMRKHMLDVSRSVKQITDIIKFVNEVAQQTNILGLNASIEAARAGASGRGFNVVASEIRRLADSSASSAKNIHYELTSISRNLEQLAAMNSEIFGCSKELSDSIAELPRTIQQLRTTAESLAIFYDPDDHHTWS